MENDNIELAIQQLRHRKLIAKKELGGFFGTTVDGQTLWFPDSLQRGWTDELTPINQRPRMLGEIAGLVGYFSDGNLNYLPRYYQGRDLAREAKMNLIANQTWKLTQENKALRNDIDSLKEDLEKLKKDKY